MDVQLHWPKLSTETHTRPAPSGSSPILWLAVAAVLFFLVPFIGTDWLGLQPDLYYLGYFTVAVARSSPHS